MRRLLRSRWIGYVGALVAVALLTLAIELVISRLYVENTSMLYLVAVLATATAFGSGPAILAAAASVVTFEWFFVEPLHTINFTSARQYMEFLLFLLTAIITGQLAAGQRRQTWEARQRERDAMLLYNLMRMMSDEPDLDRALRSVAEWLRQELRLAAVTVELSEGGRPGTFVEVGDPGASRFARAAAVTPSHPLAGNGSASGGLRTAPEQWIKELPSQWGDSVPKEMRGRLHGVTVMAGNQRVGAIYLVRAPGSQQFGEAEDRLLSAVATQLGLAIERATLRQEATETEILRRTDELKTALLSTVSHELRTPLASIIASAGSLLEKDVDWSEQEREEFAEAIEQESQRLNRLVGHILDLSRIQAGSLQPQKGWYDLGALVDDVLGRLRNVTARHRVAADLPEDLPPVLLDYVEIDQVLSNLVENAVKYAPTGTEVSISARVDGRDVEIQVADQGAGIPASALQRVFEPFYRAEPMGSWPKGTGLGLAVARGLVEAHGGRMWAENRPEGGARFVLRLPMNELPEPVPAREAR